MTIWLKERTICLRGIPEHNTTEGRVVPALLQRDICECCGGNVAGASSSGRGRGTDVDFDVRVDRHRLRPGVPECRYVLSTADYPYSIYITRTTMRSPKPRCYDSSAAHTSCCLIIRLVVITRDSVTHKTAHRQHRSQPHSEHCNE